MGCLQVLRDSGLPWSRLLQAGKGQVSGWGGEEDFGPPPRELQLGGRLCLLGRNLHSLSSEVYCNLVNN